MSRNFLYSSISFNVRKMQWVISFKLFSLSGDLSVKIPMGKINLYFQLKKPMGIVMEGNFSQFHFELGWYFRVFFNRGWFFGLIFKWGGGPTMFVSFCLPPELLNVLILIKMEICYKRYRLISEKSFIPWIQLKVID